MTPPHHPAPPAKSPSSNPQPARPAPPPGRTAAETIDLFPDPLTAGSVPNSGLAYNSTLAKVSAISSSQPDFVLEPDPAVELTAAPVGPAAPPPPAPRRRSGSKRLIGTAVVGVGFAAVVAAAALMPDFRGKLLAPFAGSVSRADLILHKVRPETLQVTVVERGTLESAENRDVVCQVKAGSKGTYASTIRWVIDDGTMVSKNQLLMELDDSLLQEQFRAQSIVVEKAKADWTTAEGELIITLKTSQSETATAEAALDLAVLDFDKFIGLRGDPSLSGLGALLGGVGTLVERGEFRQKLDDVSGRLKLADSDLEAYRDRSAWANRAVRLKYLTPSQAQVEQSKLAAAEDTVAKLAMEKNILQNFMRRRDLTDLKSKVEVARIGLDKAERQAQAKEIQAESTRKTTYSVYMQELEKLRDIEEQIRQCKIYSPQDGMVIYYKESGGRFNNNNEGLIQQGAQVKEGQKLLRIPDLRKMQVDTRVHEAMVTRIRGDDRQSTGYLDTLRAALLASPDAMTRLALNSEQAQAILREQNRDKEYVLASAGQSARVRLDSFPDLVLPAHVRSVAAVAAQGDWMSSDVKVYQTLVMIDQSVEGLRPGMSAEVTIEVDPPKEPVLCVPLQAVVGGAENGDERLVYVLTPAGPVARSVKLGMANDKMVEVRSGVLEDEQVILNPKVVVGDTAKTRGEPEAPRQAKGKGGPPTGKAKAGAPAASA